MTLRPTCRPSDGLERSAPSAALHALLRCPTDLASTIRTAKWAHRLDKRDDKADRRLEDRRDKPNDRGNGKSGKTKNTSG
jgi:hypothetical protein